MPGENVLVKVSNTPTLTVSVFSVPLGLGVVGLGVVGPGVVGLGVVN